jgi:hypothetical protein
MYPPQLPTYAELETEVSRLRALVDDLRVLPAKIMDRNDEAPFDDFWGGYFAALHRLDTEIRLTVTTITP